MDWGQSVGFRPRFAVHLLSGHGWMDLSEPQVDIYEMGHWTCRGDTVPCQGPHAG